MARVIVFPRLLSDLLDQVAPSRAAHHALDFTQHVLDLERAETAEPVLDACLGFVAAAHEAIDLGETHMRYARACNGPSGGPRRNADPPLPRCPSCRGVSVRPARTTRRDEARLSRSCPVPSQGGAHDAVCHGSVEPAPLAQGAASPGFDLRHPRGILSGPIGQPRAPYGRLAGLLGRVPMLRASRRGDRKRVPQYSSSLLRGGRTGIFREASAGCRPGTRWASRPRSAVPEGPALPLQGSPEKGHSCQRERDTPDRVGRRGSGMDKDHRVQSVTRDRTTE